MMQIPDIVKLPWQMAPFLWLHAVCNALPRNYHLALLLIYFQALTENFPFHCRIHDGTTPVQGHQSWHCTNFVIIIIIVIIVIKGMICEVDELLSSRNV